MSLGVRGELIVACMIFKKLAAISAEIIAVCGLTPYSLIGSNVSKEVGMILLVAQSRNIPSLGCSPQSEPLDEYWIHIHIVRLYFVLILSSRLHNVVS